MKTNLMGAVVSVLNTVPGIGEDTRADIYRKLLSLWHVSSDLEFEGIQDPIFQKVYQQTKAEKGP